MFSSLRAIALAVVAAGVLTFTAAQSSAFAATSAASKPVRAARTTQAAQPAPPAAPLSTTFTDPTTGALDTFTGTFTPTSFMGTKTTLTAVGSVAGTVTNAAGTVLETVNQQVSAPAAAADPSCNVLSLVLGPLDLNLLGLVVTLNQVVLNIVAESGAGNLLGNLLCTAANLLNNNGSGNLIPVANLLNHILSLL